MCEALVPSETYMRWPRKTNSSKCPT